jgi:3-oxoacid CoA-transferase subunit B
MAWSFEQMAKRAAGWIRDGYYVTLGIGVPTIVGNYIPASKKVVLLSQSGMLGMGPFPYEGEEDSDLIDAGNQTVTELPMASYFSSTDTFAMMHGGHVNLSILGGLQVSERGDLANWELPGTMDEGMGGAMDLVVGVQRVIVLMPHLAPDGTPNFRARCDLPLTGANVVGTLITDLAVFTRADRHALFDLIDLAPGVTEAEVFAKTPARYRSVKSGINFAADHGSRYFSFPALPSHR